MVENNEFLNALKGHQLSKVRRVPKSDLHNHGMMGGRLRTMERLSGRKMRKFSGGSKGIPDINDWIVDVYRPLMNEAGVFERAMTAAFMQAKDDGVVLLEMSIDLCMGRLLNLSPGRIIEILKDAHQSIAPEITFIPELGFNRTLSVRSLLSAFEPYLDSGYFRAIDLYDDESAQPVRNFYELFRFARNHGYKCKAHAGEFGDAESVRKAVEVLELDAVQHGIGAAGDPGVMKWLAKSGVQLNVCPASNIALKRVKSYKTHPIRILFDYGVKVTVNTDDVMLFNKGNSEQYLLLYKSGLFSAEELNRIRLNGLS